LSSQIAARTNTAGELPDILTIAVMAVGLRVPALPFLFAILVGEVHTRLPRPLGRLLCCELNRVLPADYARELTATVLGRPRGPQA